ncbi:ribose 5-phosphate isomerase B [Desulforegula conservatrix]|uniref:ribose 5-phosphate isomerase B n=1 Tax=Desulforegula conservatrix TaxID=153026 RepID=UPI000419B2F1|nr:ribose 5-phosphate isomerase B [Desulforegula conservatrix]
MKIIIGCDHAAYQLKDILKTYLADKGVEITDIGTNGIQSVNYPDYAKKVAFAVSKGEFDRGILLCGTGLGMSITANRFKGIRAALCNDVFLAKLSRQHNDSNILVLGARVIGDILALEILRTWLETPFEGGRHQDRINMMDDLV